MNELRDAFETIETDRQRLEIHTDDSELVTAFERQFSMRNVAVSQVPSRGDSDFLVVRSADGTFQGAMGIDHLQAMLAGEIQPPWEREQSSAATGLFDFLTETIFTVDDRKPLLATSREIEERAWRTDSGRLLVGFQRVDAFTAQSTTYERFGAETDVSVTAFVADEWDVSPVSGVDVVDDAGEEIGRYWFVLFDGGDEPTQACGLLAEEHNAGEYTGFWTYDPTLVAELIAYLDATY